MGTGTSYETVNGASITTSLRISILGKVTLVIKGGTSRADVIEADIEACNGIMHIIDAVLLPTPLPTTLPTILPTLKPTSLSCSPSIVDVALGRSDLSTLVELVTEAELVDVLKGEGPFTVFGTCSCLYDIYLYIYFEIYMNRNLFSRPFTFLYSSRAQPQTTRHLKTFLKTSILPPSARRN